MEKNSVVRLLQNQRYPTYQLHAYMASRSTAPRDGLRLAALITMHWLRQRLCEHAPAQFNALPEPSDYRTAGDACLFSFYENAGYVIDIVSLPERGLWSMQVTEPDLGSNPGSAVQERPPVPGRVMETNVAYRIVADELECGFRTVISDPEGTPECAPVYRLAIIRKLIAHPDFGLKQIVPIVHEFERITSVEQIRTCRTLLHSEEAHLPLVIFSQAVATIEPPSFADVTRTGRTLPFDHPTALPGNSVAMPPSTGETFGVLTPQKSGHVGKTVASDPPYDIKAFARSGVALCRTYLLGETMRERFNRELHCALKPGDIAVFAPHRADGPERVYPFRQGRVRQEETMQALRGEMYQYPRGREVSFGQLTFLTAARESLLHLTRESLEKAESASDYWRQQLEELNTKWSAAFDAKEAEIASLAGQLERQKSYATGLEADKSALRSRINELNNNTRSKLAEKDAEIAHLRRKLAQPKEHGDIARWAEENFSDRLVLIQRACEELEEAAARSVSVDLICDALDFLATDYWEQRYRRLTREEALSRCSRKYGRPFEITPIGNATIAQLPREYKIKYFRNEKGKLCESALDAHLRVGNDAEKLLRIYFLHDDTNKKLVIGSLPRHLGCVSIR